MIGAPSDGRSPTRLLLLTGVAWCLWHGVRAGLYRQAADVQAFGWLVGALALWILALAPHLGEGPTTGLLLVAGIWALHAVASRPAAVPPPREAPGRNSSDTALGA